MLKDLGLRIDPKERRISLGIRQTTDDPWSALPDRYPPGTPVKGKRVLVFDYVATAGTAIRATIDTVKREGGEVVGAILMLDRQEVGKEGRSSIAEIEELLGGKGRVPTILKMKDLMRWLQEHGRTEELAKMQEYWEQYGAKESA